MTSTTTRTPPSGVVGFIRALILMLERVPGAFPELVLRLGIALVFWRSGQTKLPLGNFATVMLFKEEYKIPFVAPELGAYLATTVELTTPVLLVLGLATRLAALTLLGMVLVIQIFVYPQAYPDHLLWAGPLLYLFLRGPGKWSLDAFIRDSIGGGR